MSNQEDIHLSELGKSIRESRLASGLNLHELARLCGISAPALSLIENGKRDLRVSSLIRIASALRIDVASLIQNPTETESDKREPLAQGYDLEDYQ